MEAKICYIKDKDGSTVSPVTSFDSVVDEQGNNLNDYKKKVYEITITADGWEEVSENVYFKTISVPGILESDMVNMYPVWHLDPLTRQQEKEEYSKISIIQSNNNAISLIADNSAPGIDLDVRIEVTY